jgi:hypothetical protein
LEVETSGNVLSLLSLPSATILRSGRATLTATPPALEDLHESPGQSDVSRSVSSSARNNLVGAGRLGFQT